MATRFIAAGALAASCTLAAGAQLTETESRWLHHGWPALTYAHQQKLPLDVVVLPTAKEGDAPLAMGFHDGRCKLVLAMRGNPEAEKTLASIPAPLVSAAVEAMMAHELAHCWRRVRGHWRALPAGFVDAAVKPQAEGGEIAALRREMRDARREEAFADLVGLAWTLRRHAGQYAQVHAWFTRMREDQPVVGAHHDTRTWIRLAADPAAFPSAPTPFEQVETLWKTGLASDE